MVKDSGIRRCKSRSAILVTSMPSVVAQVRKRQQEPTIVVPNQTYVTDGLRKKRGQRLRAKNEETVSAYNGSPKGPLGMTRVCFVQCCLRARRGCEVSACGCLDEHQRWRPLDPCASNTCVQCTPQRRTATGTTRALCVQEHTGGAGACHCRNSVVLETRRVLTG